MSLRQLLIILWMLAHHTLALYIPQDVEILDGYDFEESPEYYQSDAYYEARNLAAGYAGHSKSIRNRRSTSVYDAAKASTAKSKKKDTEQNVDSEKIEVIDASRESRQLPKAEKQVMEPEYYRKDSWNDYSWNIKRDDDDSISDATSDGYRARQPRVNFVTQPKKPDLEPKDRAILKVAPTSIKTHYDKYEPYKYDMYPSRSYDPYLRRYDRYDEQYSHDPYHYDEHYLYRRHYDPYDSYSPRVPAFPEPYYHYPDRRYDVPEPRDYGPLYNNEVYDRPLYENRNRRIVYYAHLPEIVRAPSSPDYGYRYDRSRYDNGRNSGTSSAAYKSEKSSDNQDSYSFVKREKKDHRQAFATVAPSKPSKRE